MLDNILFYFAGMPVYLYGFLTSLGLLFGTMSAWTKVGDGALVGTKCLILF